MMMTWVNIVYVILVLLSIVLFSVEHWATSRNHQTWLAAFAFLVL